MAKFNGVSFHDCEEVKHRECKVCGTEFRPFSGYHQFCTTECKGRWKYISGRLSTESQYKEISGDWKRYFSRLIYSAGRKRDGLTRDDLLALHENQNGLCAISGVEMTCQLEKGKRFWTNASVDRIEAGGPYSVDNIQLVCRGLNSWRSSIPLEEFYWWCEQVVKHQREIGGLDGQA